MLIAFFVILIILISIQIFLESKRKFLVPKFEEQSDFNYRYKEETVSEEALSQAFEPNLEGNAGDETFYTDGRYWLMFAVQKDIAWVGRGITLINSLFFSHAYTVFTHTGANSLYFNIFVLMCIFQLSYWYYYKKTPIVTLVFDRENKGVYVPAYVENPDIFAPFDKMVFYINKSIFGKEIVAACSITRIEDKTKIKLLADFSEPSNFVIYHKPQKIFMRYDYDQCARVLSAVLAFMGDHTGLKQNAQYQHSLKTHQDIKQLYR